MQVTMTPASSPVHHDQVLEGWFLEGQAQGEGLEQRQQGGALARQCQTFNTLQQQLSEQCGRAGTATATAADAGSSLSTL
jgi:hypothetical protein